MLTPIEIQSKSFKSGIGYDRKDVDGFMREILAGYERLYKENVELKDKISVLNDGIQYYKTIEKTLQKALVLAEQTAEETKQAALKTAKVIEKEAQCKADLIIADAKNELNRINQMIISLAQQYESYKVQYRQLASAQIDLLQSPTFELTPIIDDQLKTSFEDQVDTQTEEDRVNTIQVNEESIIDSLVNEVKEEQENEKDVRQPLVEDLFTKEELEAFEKIANYVNNESNTNMNNVTNMEDSDFTMVEEAATTLDNLTNTSEEKKESSMESEFEFIDFEVNLD